MSGDYEVEIYEGQDAISAYGVVFYVGDGGRTQIGRTGVYVGEKGAAAEARDLAKKHKDGPKVERFRV